MNIYEDTNPRELKELLYQIHSGDTVLPDFQRDFVWDANATTELILSIAQNYPAGSLLRIRNTNSLFASREFQGAPPVNGRDRIFNPGRSATLNLFIPGIYGAETFVISSIYTNAG